MNKRNNMGEPEEIHHPIPRCEGGTDEPWNQAKVSRSYNRRKGSKIADPSDVFSHPEALMTDNPIRLIKEIEKRSLVRGFRRPENEDIGFLGVRRLRLW